MPTSKKRINLSVEDDLYTELEQLKKLKGVSSISSIVIELTKEALELQEDLYFSKLAKEREEEVVISHEKIWK